MINGIEGVPGSGKSYESIVFHILPALRAGRKVITNVPVKVESFAAIDPSYGDLIEVRRRPAPIRGTWDANRVDEHGNGEAFELFDDDHVEAQDITVPLFGTVWDYYSTWKHPKTGIGPLYVIDECHVGMPKAGPDGRTSKQVIEWYKLHRHFNADVLLMTQSFRDMDQQIAKLLHMLIRVRKADIMGKKDSYIRKVHGGYRGALVEDSVRDYQPQFFPLYKSHTQGNSVAEAGASDVSPFLVKFKRFSYVVYACAAVLTIYAWWPSDKPAKPAKQAKPAGVVHAAPTITPAVHSPAPAASGAVAPAAPPADPEQGITGGPYPEPYGSHQLHVTGWIVMGGRQLHTFAVRKDGAILGSITTRDLERAGYQVNALSECAVVLTFANKQRSLVCDAPRPSFDGNRTTAAL